LLVGVVVAVALVELVLAAAVEQEALGQARDYL
jgi:hypothetical protein